MDWLWRSYRRILKKISKEKRFFFSKIDFIFLLMQFQIFSACANFREQHQSNHHHSHNHRHKSHQHPNDVTRYNRRDFAVELFTTVSEENIFPMVNLNGRQVRVLILPWVVVIAAMMTLVTALVVKMVMTVVSTMVMVVYIVVVVMTRRG